MSLSLPELQINSTPWEKRVKVVQTFLKTGSIRRTAELTGHHEVTLHKWKGEEWWNDIAQEIKRIEETERDESMTSLVKKALGIIDDRLENGEIVLNNKTGELIRKPVNLRDTTRVATELLGKQQQLRKNSIDAAIEKETVNETLKMLAGEFAKWNRNKARQEAQDVQIKPVKELPDALHAERKT